MNVLLLAALTEATGNAVTARRIAGLLSSRDLSSAGAGADPHRVVLVDSVGATASSVKTIVAEEGVHLAVGVHALLAGPFLRSAGVPYALVFGGTDLYEPMHELQQRQMARSVSGAARLIAFSPENRARAEWMWPSVAGRVELLPQAAEISPVADFSLRAELRLAEDDVLFVLPTGIRRVKDPLHVVDAFSAWHRRDPRMQLAVVGAVLEPDYAEEALAVLADRPGVRYVPALPRDRMLAAIREADVVLNTSLSEGMCGVILEAMALGTPVLARRNAGNQSLIVHGHTGLLYDTPQELVLWGRALSASRPLRERLAEAALARVEETHTVEVERAAYRAVLVEMADAARPSLLPDAGPPPDDVTSTLETAARLGIPGPVREALAAVARAVSEDPALSIVMHELGGLLRTAPPSVAMAAVAARRLDHTVGVDRARTLNLLLALMQVPDAEARAEARGVSSEIVRATLDDLVTWTAHLHAVDGSAGLTVELLAWAQRFLRGELFTLGRLQFDLRPFGVPMQVFRHRETRALEARSLDGRVIDLRVGATLDPAPPPEGDAWECVLAPGSPVLEMWIPGAVSMVSLEEIAASMREAYALFGRLAPETRPVAVCGESWRLDPQVLELFRDEPGVYDLQSMCALFPSRLDEATTIRRVFGPDVDRARLATLPRHLLTKAQRAIAGLLDDPMVSLRARGGFVLRDDAERMPVWGPR